MSKPLISIIIPVYNVEKYLQECLESVINQTYLNLEIIIVNDGSTDNSPEIITIYTEKDNRIKIINQNNKGISAARNAGMEIASGNYYAFLDADDWLDPETIQTAYEAIVNSQTDIVLWSYIREFPNKCLPRLIFDETIHFKNEDFNNLFNRIVGLTGTELAIPETIDSLVTVWGKLYKASIIKESKAKFVNTSEIGTAEDLLFNIEIFNFAKSAVALSNCFYHYRKYNTASYTSNYKATLFDQWSVLFDKIWSRIEDKPWLYEAFGNRIALSIIGLGLNEIKAPKAFKEKINFLYQIISSERYQKAYKSLSLKHFPVHWKLFFFSAKYKIMSILYIQLLIINKIISR